MQSNVNVPVSGSKFKLWLLIVVLAVLVFGGVGYGYYSWYKSNEPPPSLEAVDGSGLQGLMQIKDGVKEIQGFAKFEEGDVTECEGNVFNMEGKGTDYLYSSGEATFKDFYDSIAIKENVGRTFMFVFYSPGEEVGGTKYDKGFYLFPTDGTNYSASHVKLDELANFKIPAYRSVILFHDGTIGTCSTSGKAVQAYYDSIGASMDEEGLFTYYMQASLKPLPKGWVLVPFGWNYKNIEVLNNKLKDYVNSIWVKVGGNDAKKVKDDNKGLIAAEVDVKGTRSVWMNMKDVTDLFEALSAGDEEGGGAVVKKGGPCETNAVCEGTLGCVESENGTFCWEANSTKAVCLACKDPLKCKVVKLEDDPVKVLCDPSLVGKVCKTDETCVEGLKCTDIPTDYQGVVGGAKVCVAPEGGDCELSLNCAPGLVCAKDAKAQVAKCVESACDLCGDGECTSSTGAGFENVVCVTDSESENKECPMPGDINGDGKVDCEVDSLDLLYMIEGKISVTSCADANDDDVVDADDFKKFTEMFCPSSPEVVTLDVTAGVDQPPPKDLTYLDANYDNVLSFDFTASGGDVTVKSFSLTFEGDSSAVYFAGFDFTPDVSGFEEQILHDGTSLPVKIDENILIKKETVQNVKVSVIEYNDGEDALKFSAKLSDVEVDGDGVVVKGVPLAGNEMTVLPKPKVAEVCTGGIDEDGDGKKDCLDEDCLAEESCVGGCETDNDCINGESGDYCVSVNGAASQCMFTESFPSACPGNPGPKVIFDQQPVFIDCEKTIQ